MKYPAEQRAAQAAYREAVAAFRLRVRIDAEGWPMTPGRLGQVEWFCDGIDCHSCRLPGRFALAIHSDRPRLFDRLLAIPGVVRHQRADRELRAVFRATPCPP